MTDRKQQGVIMSGNRFLRWPEVSGRVGYSRSQVHLLVKQGKFPPPCKLGLRASAWLESSIDQWISERVSASQTNV